MRSFKAALSLLIMLTILLGLHTICFADDPLAAVIVIGDNNAKVGDTVDVAVTIGENKGIASGSFNVVFDNTKLKLEKASSDTDFMSGVLYALNDKYAESAVRISFAASAVFGTRGGELMKLTFTAIDAGDADISVEKLKLGSESEKYTTADTKITVTISGGAAVTTATETVKETEDTTAAVTAAVTTAARQTEQTSPLTQTSAETENGTVDTTVTVSDTDAPSSQATVTTADAAVTEQSEETTEYTAETTDATMNTETLSSEQTERQVTDASAPDKDQKSDGDNAAKGVIFAVAAIVLIGVAVYFVFFFKKKK